MEQCTHEFSDLFAQLGLPHSEADMQKFCGEHKIRDEESLPDAKFWSPSQSQFLREQWHQDSDWAVVIDQLNTVLRN
jgi:hypothetical protein